MQIPISFSMLVKNRPHWTEFFFFLKKEGRKGQQQKACNLQAQNDKHRTLIK